MMELLKQNHIKYGLILCATIIVCLFFMHISGAGTDFEKKSPFDLLIMLLPFVVWFLGIKAYKKELHNKMTFKQGLTEGFKISLVFGIISPFIFMFYYLLFNMEILTFVRDAYGLTGASDSIVIAFDMFVQFVASIVLGTVYSALISFFLKTKK
jgi:hypothetical protein